MTRPARAPRPRRVRPSTPLTQLRVRRSAHAYRRTLKLEMIAAYGNACACCGEATPDFLTLEHLRGDGGSHRQRVGENAQAQLVDLKRQGWPNEGYTVMCFNCNIAKGFLGACPHDNKE